MASELRDPKVPTKFIMPLFQVCLEGLNVPAIPMNGVHVNLEKKWFERGYGCEGGLTNCTATTFSKEVPKPDLAAGAGSNNGRNKFDIGVGGFQWVHVCSPILGGFSR
jgi:hypothetical protein